MAFEINGIGIVGSRRRDTDFDREIVVDKFIEIYSKGDFIISGGCPQGGDRFAEYIAKVEGIPILIFYPKTTSSGWKKFKERNTLVAKFSTKALIACVASDRKGGTEDTIKKYERLHRKKAILV